MTAKGRFLSATPAAVSEQPLPPYWWRLFNDPTLDYLVQRALVENQDLKAAAANLAYAQGQAQVDEARAGRYPSTDISFGPSWGRSPTQVQEGQGPSFSWAGGFLAAYQVDLFGRIRRTIQAAKANAEALEATEDATRVTVAAGTASAYANLCGFGRQVAVARANLDVAQKTYDPSRHSAQRRALDQSRRGPPGGSSWNRPGPPFPHSRTAPGGPRPRSHLTGMTPAELPPTRSPPAEPRRLGRPVRCRRVMGPHCRVVARTCARPSVNSRPPLYRIRVSTADLYPTHHPQRARCPAPPEPSPACSIRAMSLTASAPTRRA